MGADMQQAELVNGEFEVGFNSRFERGWHRVELAGRVVMLLVVGAALCGFLGQGPFSHRRLTAADGSIAVDFEPVARHSTATQITVHLRPPAGAATVDLLLSHRFVEPMGMLRTLPIAVREQTEGGGLRLTFAVAPGASDQLVRIIAQPNAVGTIPLTAQMPGADRVAWSQFILP